MAGAKDYSDWLTKQQAAEALGVTTKTIERMADRKEIQQAIWKRSGKPAIAVFHPDDVERVRKERSPDTPEAFVMPAADDAPQQQSVWNSDSGRSAIARREADAPVALPAFAAFVEALRRSEAGSASELRHKLFLTMEEAARYSGLPKVYLQRLIDEEKLTPVTVTAGRQKRIRRTDLEQL